MKFIEFAKVLQEIENTSKRGEITQILARLLEKIDNSEVSKAMYLLQGTLSPKYQKIDFNFSTKLVLRALEFFVPADNKDSKYLNNNVGLLLFPAQQSKKEYINKLFVQKGDIGLVTEFLLENFKNDYLPSVNEIYNDLFKLAEISGKGSQEQKILSFKKILEKLDSKSGKYVSRIIVGNLRLGISDKTILDSLSWVVSGDKSKRVLIEKAFGVRTDIGFISKFVKENKDDLEKKISKIKPLPHTPIASKLVEREISPQKVWDRLGSCFAQPKLDGLRGQIHFKNNVVSIFSRNMEDLTSHFPEIVFEVEKLKISSAILDSEIIGFDFEKNHYRSYQDTMKRRRKYNIEEYSKNIPVKAYCFDILFLNGDDLTCESFSRRIKILKNIFSEKNFNSMEILETVNINSLDELVKYYEKNVLEKKLEGIIVKDKESFYEPGTRNFNWIKLKANTRTDLVDTIDVAVLGYYGGKGDRSRFGFGALLAGVYDPVKQKYFTIGKVGSGFSEEMMKKMKKDLDKIEYKAISKAPEDYVVNSALMPDVWVKPEIIMEIDADEITRSPNHTAGKGVKTEIIGDDPSKGLSVRFPRMKKWKRDKSYPNTVSEVIRMYELRKSSVIKNIT